MMTLAVLIMIRNLTAKPCPLPPHHHYPKEKLRKRQSMALFFYKGQTNLLVLHCDMIRDVMCYYFMSMLVFLATGVSTSTTLTRLCAEDAVPKKPSVGFPRYRRIYFNDVDAIMRRGRSPEEAV
ncbi:hypothetical protein OSTOST_06322, partial [Ostertagia ostertagi]